MARKPKDQKSDLPQEEPQGVIFSFDMGAVGQGALGQGALGEAKAVSSGVRIVGTGAYEVIPTYRAGLYAEQAKIPLKRNKAIQLLLDEGVDLLDVDKKIAEYLPNFSYTELRVYSAIQRFIDEQYQPGESLEVVFTPQEFYDYCGLQKNSKGAYSGKQKEEYLEALRSLSSTPKKIIQEQSRYVGSGKGKPRLKYFTYVLTSPILQLMEADIIESDTKEEAQGVMEKAITGQELPQRKRTTRYKVKPAEIMYTLLDKLYVRKAITQYEEIKALHPGKKPNKYTDAFLTFIQTLDYSPLKIGRGTLAERMNLQTYIQQRKKTLINNTIQEALEDALRTRYILKYSEEPTGLLKIYLNPERCSRYKEKLDRTKRQEEEKA